MSNLVSRVGVPVVSIGSPNFTTLLPAVSSLVFSASGIVATNLVNNEVRQPLSLSTTYNVMIGLLGYDQTFGGYTVGYCSPGSGTVTLTGSQNTIWVQVPNANWPTGVLGQAICAVIFLQSGGGQWQQCDFAYIDQNKQFNFYITAQPLPAANYFTTAVLQSLNNDPAQQLGSRFPYAGTIAVLGPTTGGVTFDRGVSTVTISPDNGPDYTLVTTRACNLTFSTLPNAMIDFVRGTAGLFVQAPGDGTSTIRLAQQTMLTASAILKGNRHIIVQMPADATGIGETRLYLGNLTISQTAVSTSFTKTAQAAIQYNLQTAPSDTLVTSQNSEIVYQRYGG